MSRGRKLRAAASDMERAYPDAPRTGAEGKCTCGLLLPCHHRVLNTGGRGHVFPATTAIGRVRSAWLEAKDRERRSCAPDSDEQADPKRVQAGRGSTVGAEGVHKQADQRDDSREREVHVHGDNLPHFGGGVKWRSVKGVA